MTALIVLLATVSTVIGSLTYTYVKSRRKA
jgi:hypothetical protein